MRRGLLPLISLLFLCALPSHAQTFKQFMNCNAANTPACSNWSVGNTTAGDSLIGVMECGATSCGTNVPTGGPSCTFSLIATFTGLRGGGDSAYVYKCDSIGGGVQPTITFHDGGACSSCGVDAYIFEFSVTPALDQTGSNSSTTGQTTLTVSTSGSTGTANELVIAAFFAQTQTPGLSAGYTNICVSCGNQFISRNEYKTVSSTGVQSASSSATSTAYSAIIVTFGTVVAGSAASAIAGPSKVVGPTVLHFMRPLKRRHEE